MTAIFLAIDFKRSGSNSNGGHFELSGNISGAPYSEIFQYLFGLNQKIVQC